MHSLRFQVFRQFLINCHASNIGLSGCCSNASRGTASLPIPWQIAANRLPPPPSDRKNRREWRRPDEAREPMPRQAAKTTKLQFAGAHCAPSLISAANAIIPPPSKSGSGATQEYLSVVAACLSPPMTMNMPRAARRSTYGLPRDAAATPPQDTSCASAATDTGPLIGTCQGPWPIPTLVPDDLPLQPRPMGPRRLRPRRRAGLLLHGLSVFPLSACICGLAVRLPMEPGACSNRHGPRPGGRRL